MELPNRGGVAAAVAPAVGILLGVLDAWVLLMRELPGGAPP